MNNRNKQVLLIVLIATLLLTIVTVAYAYFIASNITSTNQTIEAETGTMKLVMSDGTDGWSEVWNFGESKSKTFTLQNTGSLPVSVDLYWKNLVNTYLSGSMVYSLKQTTDENVDTYLVGSESNFENVPTSQTSTSTEKIAKNISVPANKTYTYTLTIKLVDSEDIDQTADLTAEFYTEFDVKEYIDPAEASLKALGLTVNEGTPNFSRTSCTVGSNNGSNCGESTVGVYETQDDYGTSYYFRGNVENNYVKFGKNASNQDMYWRIIRVNGDGSLRMIYDGTQAYPNGTSNTDRVALTNIVWNSNYNDAKYVGYMFGGVNGTRSTSYESDMTSPNYAVSTNAVYNETSSYINTKLDEWYTENLEANYGQYLSDEVFCNDRSIDRYESRLIVYQASNRLNTNKIPSLICLNKNDKFTVNDTEVGNGALTKPIGLITADEVSFAGGRYTGSNNYAYYLYKGTWYWSFSPDDCINELAYVMHVTSNIYSVRVDNGGGLAPVINLAPEYVLQLQGNGTIGNEYHL